MPDLCKLMTSTFILFRSPSLLYQTANFLNWRLFKMNSAGALLLCKRLGRLSHIWLTGVDQRATLKHFRKKKKETALGVMYGYRTCFWALKVQLNTSLKHVQLDLSWRSQAFGWCMDEPSIYTTLKKKQKLSDLDCFLIRAHLFYCFVKLGAQTRLEDGSLKQTMNELPAEALSFSWWQTSS